LIISIVLIASSCDHIARDNTSLYFSNLPAVCKEETPIAISQPDAKALIFLKDSRLSLFFSIESVKTLIDFLDQSAILDTLPFICCKTEDA